MKIIALEEHFVTENVREAWVRLSPGVRDINSKTSENPGLKSRLEDFAGLRLKEMDESGVDVQVLSLTTPGVQSLEAAQAVEIARQPNDFLSEIVKKQPDSPTALKCLPRCRHPTRKRRRGNWNAP